MLRFFSKIPLFKAAVIFCIVALLIPVLMVLILRFADPATWMWQLQREISPPAGYPQTSEHQWIPLEKISPRMQLAVIASEDQKFPEHWGFDLESIGKALQENEQGNRIRGASTLTQQTAKNLFLWPSKSYFRKGVEAGFTLLMETLWDKPRILEVYLNIAEFGPGVYGVEAASQKFFGKPASKLTNSSAKSVSDERRSS